MIDSLEYKVIIVKKHKQLRL